MKPTTALDLESLLASAAGFGLTTASGLQRAIVRAASGRPIGDALDDAAIRAHFGCDREALRERPALVVVIAGVRGGKSLMASCAAAHSALSCDLDQTQPYEVVRVPIVAPTVDNAGATFGLLTGAFRRSPVLRKLVVDETADSLTVKRPDGRLVELCVVAAHRGGIALRSRWLGGFALEETALFGSDVTGASVNAEELLRAAETRLLRGGQGWIVSSPFGPQGLLYTLYRTHFGRPGRVLVVHAPTRALNPSFPEEQIEAVRQRDPDAAAREYDAGWVDADSTFLEAALVHGAARATPVERPAPDVRWVPHHDRPTYVAAMDPATRGNAWTLVVVERRSTMTVLDPLVSPEPELPLPARVRFAVMAARQWVGSKSAPLDPNIVLREIKLTVGGYGLSAVHTDQWSSDAIKALARPIGIRTIESSLGSAEDRFAAYDEIRTLLTTQLLELPPVPAFLSDLKALRKKATANGVRIELPLTSDGRHCDFAPSLALALKQVGSGYVRRIPRGLVWSGHRGI